LYERFYCYYEDHDYSAASDLYLSCTGQDYALVLKNAVSNIKLTEELLDKSVEEFPNFPQTLLRRGHFFEWLGDRAKSDDTRNEFYKKALLDYDSASKLDTVAFPEVRLDRFNLYMKLNDLSDARRVFESASALTPDSIETHLMNLEILQKEGKRDEAATAFASCFAEITRKYGAVVKSVKNEWWQP
jgi:tetratricopeptide (TPR) repeat protein